MAKQKAYRKFDETRYDFQRHYRVKVEALKFAKRLRKRGTRARIIKRADGWYEVYAQTS